MDRDASERTGTAVRRRLRLGRELLGWFLVLSLVPLAGASVIGYVWTRSIIESQVARYLEGIAHAEAVYVGGQVREQLLLLERIALSLEPDPASGSPLPSDSLLFSIFDRQRALEALFVVDEGGTILSSAPVAPADLLFWLPETLESPGDPLRVSRSGVAREPPTLRLLAPLGSTRQLQRRFLGALVIPQAEARFLEIPPHVAGIVETFVLDSEGIPLFVSHPHGHVDFSIPLATPLLESAPGRAAQYEDRLGVPVIGTILPVPGTDWWVVTEVPVETALAELTQLRHLSLVLTAVLAGLVVLSSSFVAARIVAPVRGLVAATRRIGSGDLGARVDLPDTNEIGELGAAFNQMADDLARTSAEVEALHQQEMRRAGQLATVGELASGLAHEIKNPVVSISNGLDLVMRHTEVVESLAPITAEMKRQLSRIEVAVRDLLAFARPAEPSLTCTRVHHLVERALMLAKPAAERARVSLRLDEDAVDGDLVVDEAMLVQVLINLVFNGIQATESGGEVVISTRRQAERWIIEIRDTGSGISDEQLSKIFKPFYTTKHRGTGLGLSISRGIVERHGGSLTVRSREGAGTSFFVSLPASTGPPGEAGGSDASVGE